MQELTVAYCHQHRLSWHMVSIAQLYFPLDETKSMNYLFEAAFEYRKPGLLQLPDSKRFKNCGRLLVQLSAQERTCITLLNMKSPVISPPILQEFCRWLMMSYITFQKSCCLGCVKIKQLDK